MRYMTLASLVIELPRSRYLIVSFDLQSGIFELTNTTSLIESLVINCCSSGLGLQELDSSYPLAQLTQDHIPVT